VAKKAKLSVEEYIARFEKRAVRLRAQVPRSFKGAARILHVHAVDELVTQVYNKGAGPNSRSGHLLRGERIRFIGDHKAEIYNGTTNVWGGKRTNYAQVLHQGRGKMTTPTSGGKKHYLWLYNKGDKRPYGKGAWKEWLKLVREKKAGMAKDIKAMPARPWRNDASKKCHEKIARFLQVDAVRRVLRVKQKKEPWA